MANNKGTDIEKAFDAITNKRSYLDLLFRYVNGGQPLKYSTERLKEIFDDINTHFEINWCTVVVDSSLDRMELNGFHTDDDVANTKLVELFDLLHISTQSDDAHLGALSVGSAYVIVWQDDAGELELYYNDPRICHIFYDSSNPIVKTFAAKIFVRDDRRTEITLYYPERIEHWVTKAKTAKASTTKTAKANDFELDEETGTEENTFGVIPVFGLITPSEIAKVTTIQDAINKMFADMMVAAEFGAFASRYIISQSDEGDLKSAPNEIWWIPSGDGQGQAASVGQFDATDLNNYLKAMDSLANSMAIITRTPKHYMMTTGANISGEALIAMESPLVRKVKKHKMRFDISWQEIAQFMLQLSNITIEASKIEPVWERVESVQPKTEAETRLIAINTGIPLTTQLKREGWTEQEIKELEKQIAADQATKSSLAQAVLDRLRIKDEQTNLEE